MASEQDVCTNYPDFAVICSFIENFSEKLKLNLPNIEELQILLEDTENVHPNLAQSFNLLMRKINKGVKFDKWERGLQRFAHLYSHQDAWELEKFGFKKAKLEVKIRVLKNLLETQFDLYKSFKEKVNLVSAKDLRLQPCGRDRFGVSYWCQLDEFANLRIYKDDQDEETWTLVARSREELVALIEELEQQQDPSKTIAREASVEESHSGTTTPMVLSEAPTPVDSKATTPVTSGRTSPILDTGQPREKLVDGDVEMHSLNDPLPDVPLPSKLKHDSESQEGLKSKAKLEDGKEKEIEIPPRNSPDEKQKMKRAAIKAESTSVAPGKTIPNSDPETKISLEKGKIHNMSDTSVSKAELPVKEAKAEPAKALNSSSSIISSTVEIQKENPSDSITSLGPIPKTSLEFKKKASNLDAVLNLSLAKTAAVGKLEAKVAAMKGSIPLSQENREKSLPTEDETLNRTQKEKTTTSNEEGVVSVSLDSKREKHTLSKAPKEPDKETSRGHPIPAKEQKRKIIEKCEFEPENKKSKVDIGKEKQVQLTDPSKIASHQTKRDKQGPAEYLSTPLSVKETDAVEQSKTKLKESLVVTSSLKSEAKGKDLSYPCLLQPNTGGKTTIDSLDLSTNATLQTGINSDKVAASDSHSSLTPAKTKSISQVLPDFVASKREKKVEKPQTDVVKIPLSSGSQLKMFKEIGSPGSREKMKLEKVEICDKLGHQKVPNIKLIGDTEVNSKPETQNHSVESKMAPKSLEIATSSKTCESKLKIEGRKSDFNPKITCDDIKSKHFISLQSGCVTKSKHSETKSPESNAYPLTQNLPQSVEKSLLEVKNPSEKNNEPILKPPIKLEQKSINEEKMTKKSSLDQKITTELKKNPLAKVTTLSQKEVQTTAKDTQIYAKNLKATEIEMESTIRSEAKKILKPVQNPIETNLMGKSIESKARPIINPTGVETKHMEQSKLLDEQKITSNIMNVCGNKPKATPKFAHPEPHVKLQEKSELGSCSKTGLSTGAQESVNPITKSELEKLVKRPISKLEAKPSADGKRDAARLATKDKMSHELLKDFLSSQGKDSPGSKTQEMEMKFCPASEKLAAFKQESGTPQTRTSNPNVGKDNLNSAKLLHPLKDDGTIFKKSCPSDTTFGIQEKGRPFLKSSLQGPLEMKMRELHEAKELATRASQSNSKHNLPNPGSCLTDLRTSDISVKSRLDSTLSKQLNSQELFSCTKKNSLDVSIKDAFTPSQGVGPSSKKEETSKEKGAPVEPSKDKGAPLEACKNKGFHLETCKDKGAPLETSKDKVSPLETCKDKGAPVESSKDKVAPVKTSKVKGASLETSKDKGSPLETSKNKGAPAETYKDKGASVETSKNKEALLETSKYKGAPVGTKDMVAPVETRKDKGAPVETSKDEGAPVETYKDKGASVETYKDKGAPVETSKNKGAPVETSKNKGAPLETSKDKRTPVETSKDKGAPVETSKNKGAPVETSKDKGAPVETSKDKGAPVETSKDKGAPVETSKDKVAPVETSKDKGAPVETLKHEGASIESSKYKGTPTEIEGKTASSIDTSKCDDSDQSKADSTSALNHQLKADDPKEKDPSLANPPSDLSSKPDSGFDLRAENVGEAIVEPVMVVKGEGEGALCEAGNPLSGENCSKCCVAQSSFRATILPWWEDFTHSPDLEKDPDKEVVVEEVLYFVGDGEGALCEAGNSGDEDETRLRGSGTDAAGGASIPLASLKGTEEGLAPSSAHSHVFSNPNMHNQSQGHMATPGVHLLTPIRQGEMNGLKVDHTDGAILASNHSTVKGVGPLASSLLTGGLSGADPLPEEAPILTTAPNDINGKADDPGYIPPVKAGVQSAALPSPPPRKGRGRPKKGTWKKLGNQEEPLPEAMAAPGNPESLPALSSDFLPTPASHPSPQSNPNESLSAIIPDSKLPVPSSPPAAPSPPVMRSRAKAGILKKVDPPPIEEPFTPSPKGRRKAKKVQSDDMSVTPDVTDAPRQRSARIAKIREREESERRELEAERLRQIAEENHLKELKKKARTERRYLREMKKSKKEKKEKKDKDKRRKKRKKRVKKKTNQSDPWAHSSTSSSSSSSEDELDMEEDEELVFKSDHEFSPESDVGEEDATPIKRARTAKKAPGESEEAVAPAGDVGTTAPSVGDYDDTTCAKCLHQDHPETILLCDNCDQGWHLSCLRPPLLSVPEGDWTCPVCEHSLLIEKLRSILADYDAARKRAENEELRRQRLAYINISLDNVLPEKRKKKRHHTDNEEDEDDTGKSDSEDSDSESDAESDSSSSSSHSDSSGPLYTLRARPSRTPKEQLENFDELINEAIRDEMEAAMVMKKTVVHSGKDLANLVENVQEGLESGNENDEEAMDDERYNKEAAMTDRKEEPMEKEEELKQESTQVKKEEITDQCTTNKGPVPEKNIGEDPEKDKKEFDEKGITPSKKRKKEEDEDYGEEEDGSNSESEVESPPKRGSSRRSAVAMSTKKKRRLTDLDVEEDEDDSDEYFLGTSEDDEEEEVSDAMASSSFEMESDSDDDSDAGGRKGRGRVIMPLRRSARNRRNASFDDYDSEVEKRSSKKTKKKKKARTRRYNSSSEDDEFSSDSDSYGKKKRAKTKRRAHVRSKKGGRKGGKKKAGKRGGGGKKAPKKKAPIEDGDEEQQKPKPKPRVKYAKPVKVQDEEEEENSRRRVTRGRQINYYHSLFMSDDEDDEEESKPQSRGKVMKGERHVSESSEYEESADERKKRRGVRGGLGRGKVMKSEEEEEEEEEYRKEREEKRRKKEEEDVKKRIENEERQKREDEKEEKEREMERQREKQRQNADKSKDNVIVPLPTVITLTPGQKAELPKPPSVESIPRVAVLQGASSSKKEDTPIPPFTTNAGASISPVVTPRTPLGSLMRGASPACIGVRPPFSHLVKTPNGARPSFHPVTSTGPIMSGSSSVSITPVAYGTPRPVLGPRTPTAASLASVSVHPVSSAPKGPPEKPQEVSPAITISTKRGTPVGRNSPGPLPPVGKWSPHLIGTSGNSATPPRVGTVNSSPPPPYRSSPLPVTITGVSSPMNTAPHSTIAHRGTPPNLPPTSSHPTGYPPYPSPDHFPSHPGFPPNFHPASSHSPGPHGAAPSRHPIPASHSIYGSPVPPSNFTQGLPPHHPGVLRGPPHDLYRHPSPGHGSPNHPGHPRPLLLKQGYPGLEPLAYPRSPGPIDATGRHNSPGPPSLENKEEPPPKRATEGGEFSSGLMSYFSSQRDENVE